MYHMQKQHLLSAYHLISQQLWNIMQIPLNIEYLQQIPRIFL